MEYRKNYLSFVFSPVVGASPSTTSPPSFLSEERSYWSSTSTFKHQDEKTEGTHLRYGFCDVIEENKLTRNDEKTHNRDGDQTDDDGEDDNYFYCIEATMTMMVTMMKLWR